MSDAGRKIPCAYCGAMESWPERFPDRKLAMCAGCFARAKPAALTHQVQAWLVDTEKRIHEASAVRVAQIAERTHRDLERVATSDRSDVHPYRSPGRERVRPVQSIRPESLSPEARAWFEKCFPGGRPRPFIEPWWLAVGRLLGF